MVTLHPGPNAGASSAEMSSGLCSRMAVLMAGAMRLALDATSDSPSTRRVAPTLCTATMISAGVIRKPLHPRLEVRTPGCNCSSVQKPMKTRVPAILQLCSPGTRCTVVNRPLVQHPSRSAQLHSCARGAAVVHRLRKPPRTATGGNLGNGCSRRRCSLGRY